MPSPCLPLDQQLVIVTGASRGLGSAIARAFLREGARVVINYLNSDAAARELAASAPDLALAVQADVRDAEAVAAMVARASEHFGRPVSTVVNNALPAFQFDGDARPHADTLDWARMNAQLEGSVRAALNTTQAVLPSMRAASPSTWCPAACCAPPTPRPPRPRRCST